MYSCHWRVAGGYVVAFASGRLTGCSTKLLELDCLRRPSCSPSGFNEAVFAFLKINIQAICLHRRGLLHILASRFKPGLINVQGALGFWYVPSRRPGPVLK